MLQQGGVPTGDRLCCAPPVTPPGKAHKPHHSGHRSLGTVESPQPHTRGWPPTTMTNTTVWRQRGVPTSHTGAPTAALPEGPPGPTRVPTETGVPGGPTSTRPYGAHPRAAPARPPAAALPAPTPRWLCPEWEGGRGGTAGRLEVDAAPRDGGGSRVASITGVPINAPAPRLPPQLEKLRGGLS